MNMGKKNRKAMDTLSHITEKKETIMRKNKKTYSFSKLPFFSALIVVLFCLSTGLIADAEDATEEQLLVDKAVITFKYFMIHSEMDYFREHLKDGKALLIVPSFIKVGFVLGGAGGSGVLLARDEKTGEWSDPAFYTIGTGSLGFQIGAQKSQMILVIKSQKVVESLYASSFKMGGDISVAAGPEGTGAAAKGLNADIVSFARSKWAFVGMSFDGSMISTKDKSNHAYYGKTVSPVDIFVRHSVSNPHSTKLREALTEATKSP
jgi:lipid-binding SYLF domain-containing protein